MGKSAKFLILLFVIAALLACRTDDDYKKQLLGMYDPACDTAFVEIEEQYADCQGMYVRREVLDAFLAMRSAAADDSIDLFIVSATRTYDRQRQIWERKWQASSLPYVQRIDSIMQYSAMPGTSRHHWGTDIDLISVENDDWATAQGMAVLEWLTANASQFGFFRPYSDSPERTGYQPEPWHWSYAPLADKMLDDYMRLISPDDISGFDGAEYVRELDIINIYVLGIDTVR